jgi:hypothetical protein
LANNRTDIVMYFTDVVVVQAQYNWISCFFNKGR